VKAVDGISFSVAEGSLFAFLGLNGAGKSTTIGVLSGTLKKTGGGASVCGTDIDGDLNAVKREIGIVFQGSVLDSELTVADNLQSRAALYGFSADKIRERIAYAADTFDLADLMRRQYGKLSGGQRRRVDIARAFLNEPRLLFLDEPTTGLDPVNRALIWDILEEQKRRRGLTVFLTTHYMEEAARADRAVIIDDGKILADDTPDNLKNRFSRYRVRLIGADTAANAEIIRRFRSGGNKKNAAGGADGNAEIIKDINESGAIYENGAYTAAFTTSVKAYTFLSAMRRHFDDYELLKGNMDDVFLAVTGKRLEA
jgi:ABC-type multidrug transport system ATPase subunit